MQSSMLRHITEDFGNGGTIDGDLTISGDLTVSGGGSLSFDEIIEGTSVIDVTDTEAFLVRKDSDGGDVFTVDTTNEQVKVGDNFIVNASGTTPVLTITGTRNDILFTESDTSNLNTLVRQQTGLFRIDTINDALDTVTRRFTIDHSTGNVGINEDSPANHLHVFGATANGVATFESGDAKGGIVLKDNSTSNNVFLLADGDDFFIQTGGTENRLRVESNGNVGIGSSPNAKVDIRGDDLFIGNADTDASSRIFFNENSSSKTQGFSLLYAGSANPTLGGQAFTASANTFNIIRHNNDLAGATALSIDRTSGDATFNGSIKILDTSAPSIRLNPDASDATDNDRAFIGYATGNDNFITGTVDNDLAIRSSATGNIVFGRGTTESARLDSSGNLVVGQTTAQQKFEVHGGGIRIAGNIATPSSGVTGALIDYFGSDTRFWSRGADASTVGSFKFIGLENDGGNQSTQLEIDSSGNATFAGNVGIGVSPTTVLNIKSAQPVLKLEDTTAYNSSPRNRIEFRNIFNADTVQHPAGYIDLFSSNSTAGNYETHMAFTTRTASSGLVEAMRIDSSQNLSIGTSADTAKYLKFVRGGSGTGSVRGSIGTNNSKLTFIGGSGSSSHMTLDSSGQLGIGTTIPNSLLEVSGTSAIRSTYTGTSSAGVGGALQLVQDDGSAIESGHRIGYVVFGASEDSSNTIHYGGSINAFATETYSASGNGTKLTFDVTANGGTSRSTALTLDQDKDATFSGDVNIQSATSDRPILNIENQNADNSPPAIHLYKNSSSPANSDQIGDLSWYAKDDGGTKTRLILFRGFQTNVSASADSSKLSMYTTKNGVETETLTLEAGVVGIGTASPTSPASVGRFLHIADAGSAGIVLEDTNAGDWEMYNASGVLYFEDRGNSALALALDVNSRISLSNNDNGSNNTVFGKLAGVALASGGQHNLCIGEESGHDITTGDNNVSVGSYSNDKVSTNGDNTAIGYEAHRGDGGQNTVVGSYAVDHESGQADSIVAVGHQAMRGDLTSSADGTVAVGAFALGALTSGAGAVAIGYQAMDGNSSGDHNTAIGYQALSAEDTGDRNTAVGFQSLLNVNGANNNANTALGFQSGDLITTGTLNTCIGASTDTSANSAVNQTVIGYNATGVADNSVTLGNADVTDVYMAQDSDATVHCTGIKNNFRDAVSVGTTATVITPRSQYGGLAMVWMNSGGNIAHDLVSFSLSDVDVLATQSISGSAASRTYTAVNGELKVAMASGTYDVYAVEIRVSD